MKRLTPIKAIRAKCLECCCNEFKEVRVCHMDDCPLWPYRMGRRPRADDCTQRQPEQGKGELTP